MEKIRRWIDDVPKYLLVILGLGFLFLLVGIFLMLYHWLVPVDIPVVDPVHIAMGVLNHAT